MKLDKILTMDFDGANELLSVYALLALTVGENCTNEHIHDAWAVWQNKTDSGHCSIIPYKSLTKEVQDMDTPYRDAVIKVAKELGR